MNLTPPTPYTVAGPAVISCLDGHWSIQFFATMELALFFARTLADTLKPAVVFCADLPTLTFAPGQAPTISEDPNASN